MTMDTSPRLGIQYPDLDRSAKPDIPLHIKNLIDWLDIAALIYSGTNALKPPSSAGAPGKIGRWYWATDTSVLWFDYGTGWVQIYPQAGTPDGSITGGPAGAGVKLAAHTITSDNIAVGAITTTEILDGTILATDLAAGLKPSAGAGAGAEALRALGTAAGNAAAGLHAAQHQAAGADPISVTQAMLAAGAAAGQGYGTALPTVGLYNGYRFMLVDADATSSVMWDLVYRADLDPTYPWHFVGGGSLKGIVTGALVAASPFSGYVNGSTPGPSITLPYAGVYEIEVGHAIDANSAGDNNISLSSYSMGATAASDEWAAQVVGGPSGSANVGGGMRRVVQTGLAAATVIQHQIRHRGTGGGSMTFNYRTLSVRPVKIG